MDLNYDFPLFEWQESMTLSTNTNLSDLKVSKAKFDFNRINSFNIENKEILNKYGKRNSIGNLKVPNKA